MKTPAVRQIGRFQIQDVIGKGGMGVVYRAVDTTIGRTVAIKMLHAHYAEDKEFLARFHREVRSTATLQHKNIVTVYGLEEFQGAPYMVLEYLDGPSMAEIISAKRPLRITEKIGLLVQVCEGLHYAHQREVIHRDVKPANVLVLQDGTAKIVDFGIARAGQGETITRTGLVMGSISYMSPEQITGAAIDQRTDIYSAGVTLYQLLAGELPFKDGGSEANAILVKILNHPVPALSNFLSDYPPELDEILNRAMAKDVSARYQSAEEFAFELCSLQETLHRGMTQDLLREAKNAAERRDWDRARQNLQDILRYDTRNTEANELFRQVRSEFQQQQRSVQVQQLRSQTQSALAAEHFEEALECADQALRIDPSNSELIAFAGSVRSQVEQARKFVDALRRGNAALYSGDLGDAQRAAREALEIRANDSEARSLDRLVKKELEERDRRAQHKVLLEEARRNISDRDFLSALKSLKKAQAIDPSDTNIRELLNWAARGHEQEKQRAELQSHINKIEDLLDRELYQQALEVCQAGLSRFAQDPSLEKLKRIASRQCEAIAGRAAVDAASAQARALAEEHRYGDAIQLLRGALEKSPGEENLEILLSIMQAEAEAQQRAERRKQEDQVRAEPSGTGHREDVQVVALLQDALSRGLPLSKVEVMAERVSRLIAAKSADDALRQAGTLALEEYRRRLSGREEACGQLDGIAGALENVRTGAEATRLLEKARSIAENYRHEEEVGSRFQAISAAFEKLHKQCETVRAKINELVRSMHESDDLERLERTEAEVTSLATFWSDDTAIALLAGQASFYAGQARRRRAERLREAERLARSVQGSRSAGQIKLLEEQASMLSAGTEDPQVLAVLDRAGAEIRSRLTAVQGALVTLRTLAERVATDRDLASAESAAREASGIVALLGTYEEVAELGRRVEHALEERRREHGRIVSALKKLVQSAADAGAASDLELILARRRDLIAKFPEEATLQPLAHEVDTVAATRRKELALLASQERAALEAQKASEENFEFQLPVRVPTGPVIAKPVPIAITSNRRGRAFAGACLAGLLLSGATIFWFGANPSVDLQVNPSGARLSVDGQACENPCSIRLHPGTHELAATSAGFAQLDRAIQVPWFGTRVPPLAMLPLPNAPVPPMVVASPRSAGAEHNGSKVVVDVSTANAQVYLDGRLQGRTGNNGQLRLSATNGVHELRVEKQGYSATIARVEIHDQDLQVRLALQSQLAGIGVKPAPVIPSAAMASVPAAAAPNNAPPAVNSVSPAPPPVSIRSFIASVDKVSEGQPVVLSWQTENADDISIEGIGPVPPIGTKQVNLDHSTTFKMFARGPGGVAAPASVHVEVVAAVKAVTPAPVTAPTVAEGPAAVDGDRQAIQSALRLYQEAYQSESLDDMRKVWPGIPKAQQKSLKEVFSEFNAIRVNLAVKNVQVQGDRARVVSNQTITYTRHGLKSDPTVGPVTIDLKREGNAWIIESLR